jgi:hypothetical protein
MRNILPPSRRVYIYRQYLAPKRRNPPIWLYDVIIQYNSIWVFNDVEVSDVIVPCLFEFKVWGCILRYWKRELNTALALGANKYKISFQACLVMCNAILKMKVSLSERSHAYCFIRSLLKHRTVRILSIHMSIFYRSQWPRGLGHELSSLTRTLGSWVRILLKAWMSVWVCSVFVLRIGSGLASRWSTI